MTEIFGNYLGESFAILAALNWACAVVLFKRSGESVPPLALNLFKNAIGIVLLLVTLPLSGEGLDAWRTFHPHDVYILILSGVLGIALADTILFYGLNLAGVGIISITDCTYSPFAILFAFLLLGEEITAWHFVGMGLILSGVLLVARHAPPPDRTSRQIVIGALCGTLAIAMMAVGIVYAKPVLTLQGFPLIWATTIRMLFGSIALALFAVASRDRRTHWSSFKPSSSWKFSIPASVLGAYLAMIFWVGGFKYAQASVAAILNQSATVFAIILAAVFLKEPFSRRKLAAVTLAMLGVIVVVLSPLLE